MPEDLIRYSISYEVSGKKDGNPGGQVNGFLKARLFTKTLQLSFFTVRPRPVSDPGVESSCLRYL